VVAIDDFGTRWVVTLDDGCGMNIEAVCAAPPQPTSGAASAVIAGNASMPGSRCAGHAGSRVSPDGPDLSGIDVGMTVKLKGTIGHYREQRQLRLKRIFSIGDTNAEVKCWRQIIDFRENVLNTAWVVSAAEERECLEKQERALKRLEEMEAKAKRRKLKNLVKERKRELSAPDRSARTGGLR
jgi:hypothetical protein